MNPAVYREMSNKEPSYIVNIFNLYDDDDDVDDDDTDDDDDDDDGASPRLETSA